MLYARHRRFIPVPAPLSRYFTRHLYYLEVIRRVRFMFDSFPDLIGRAVFIILCCTKVDGNGVQRRFKILSFYKLITTSIYNESYKMFINSTSMSI